MVLVSVAVAVAALLMVAEVLVTMAVIKLFAGMPAPMTCWPSARFAVAGMLVSTLLALVVVAVNATVPNANAL